MVAIPALAATMMLAATRGANNRSTTMPVARRDRIWVPPIRLIIQAACRALMPERITKGAKWIRSPGTAIEIDAIASVNGAKAGDLNRLA